MSTGCVVPQVTYCCCLPSKFFLSSLEELLQHAELVAACEACAAALAYAAGSLQIDFATARVSS